MQLEKIKAKIYNGEQLSDIKKLDINKLGRPYYKLPKIIADYFDILDAKISFFFLKKYRVNLSLKNVTTEMDCSHKNTKIFSSKLGHVAFDTERNFLLNILNDYYGLSKNSVIEPSIHVPITQTEDRLKNKLGLELTELFLNHDDFGEKLAFKTTNGVFIKQWSYRLIFSLAGDEQHVFYILLDANHADRILHSQDANDEENKKTTDNNSPLPLEKLFNKLPISLNIKLISVNLTLAELKALEKGEIISISMPDHFPVFIGTEQIFSAIITENRGKLFLTEFNEKNRLIPNEFRVMARG
ncbi:FliM/FliN family flagellar motor switch protein [Candidatus Regiella endosymbiont of Tuberolachnus salignus]|uniref:FliM/FliN family flagellar motor switch protein n=1 Tax=Candidatus Regiella endosymbiont of Tuberolachnus salignus TaxID=3077956 RepID=UPI0030CA6EF2